VTPAGLMRQTAKGLTSPLLPGGAGADLTRLTTTVDHFINEQWAYNQAGSQGLAYGYKGGVVQSASAVARLADGTVTLVDDAVNYVERDAGGSVSANTNGFTPSKTPMAKVTTSQRRITVVEDWRTSPPATASGSSSGLTGSGSLNQLAKFTPTGTALGDSIIADDGATVTVDGALDVTGTVTFTTPLGDASIASAATWNAKQAAYANLTTIGGLANAAGWLHNDGSGVFAYSTPTLTGLGIGSWTGSTNLVTAGMPFTAADSAGDGIELSLSGVAIVFAPVAAGPPTYSVFRFNGPVWVEGELQAYAGVTVIGLSTASVRFDVNDAGTLSRFQVASGSIVAYTFDQQVRAPSAQLSALPAFAAGDKYVVADASGNLHLSALGPAS